MIRHISIRNFAIIESSDIDFHDGLNIITGETGSGKSIMIEAVSLALGSRADTAFVRSGAKKAVIQMVAELEGNEYIITREISAAGKNLCKINDEIVTLTHLNELCKRLADIHGQYDHQSLLNPEYHIKLVDLYQKDQIEPAKKEVEKLHERYSGLKSRLKKLRDETNRNKREQDFMEYELHELEDADLKAGEDSQLEDEIALLQNSEKIYENLTKAYMLFSEEDYSALPVLKNISGLISDTSVYSKELEELSERIETLYYELEDSCTAVRECRDRAVFSPDALDSAIARLEVINKLKSKHNKTVDELISYRDFLSEKLSEIENSDTTAEKLEKELLHCSNELTSACEKLSSVRKEAASELEQKITAELAQLNFNDAVFSVSFSRTSDFSASGFDIVEFMISTNRGEPIKPLSKIASGGEMSRIMLAFKKITGDYDGIPTMIFDEIDSGISGIAASTVGKKLSEIAENHQIICITHLPQIAAFGSHNYIITKNSDENMTYTTVKSLDEEGKVREIARLLGGANITETTLKSAEELISASV